jgi:hypothetical protein
MHGLKRLSERLMARTFERQAVELMCRVALLNRFSQGPLCGGPRGVTLSGGWGNHDHCATKQLQISNDTLVDFCASRENHT